MKKFKKVAIALTLAMLVAITATGCNACPGDQELYFNNSFDTDFALSNGKQEVCVYDLQVNQAFNEELTKSGINHRFSKIIKIAEDINKSKFTITTI